GESLLRAFWHALPNGELLDPQLCGQLIKLHYPVHLAGENVAGHGYQQAGIKSNANRLQCFGMSACNAPHSIVLLRIDAVDPDYQIIEPCLSEFDCLFHCHLQAWGEQINHCLLRVHMPYQLKDVLSEERISLGKGYDTCSHIQGLVDDPLDLFRA